jgi:hypothetical protein
VTEVAAAGALLQQRAATDCEARLRRILAALLQLHDDPTAEGALIAALSEAREARSLCTAVRLDGLADALTSVGNSLQTASEQRKPPTLDVITGLLHVVGQLRAEAAGISAGQPPGRLDPDLVDELTAAGLPPTTGPPATGPPPASPQRHNSTNNKSSPAANPGSILDEVKAARLAIELVKADLARHIEILAQLQAALTRAEEERSR